MSLVKKSTNWRYPCLVSRSFARHPTDNQQKHLNKKTVCTQILNSSQQKLPMDKKIAMNNVLNKSRVELMQQIRRNHVAFWPIDNA